MNVRGARRVLRAASLTVSVVVGVSCLTAVALLQAPEARAAAGDVGTAGGAFAGFATITPTAPKSESKLWYAHGSWWASMASLTTLGYRIARLDRATHTWVDAGVDLDTRGNTQADILWNGQHLLVASHVVSSSSTTAVVNQPARLLRYSWTGSTWARDPGFPATISNYSAESMTIAQDSNGTVWASFTRSRRLYVVKSTGSGDAESVVFGTPYIPTLVNLTETGSTTATTLTSDDISAVVSASGVTTVVWGNQLNGTYYAARRADSASTWRASTIVSGTRMSDDHLNVKTIPGDSQGRVFVALKTALSDKVPAVPTDPLLMLAVYKPASSTWVTTPIASVAESGTRPLLVLDAEADTIHAYYTGPTTAGIVAFTGTVYEKSASLSSPTFSTGLGTPVLRDSASATMNNATSTKQTTDAVSGRVVLAATEGPQKYWFSDFYVPPPPAPSASFTASPTSGTVPVTTVFTDTSTGAPTSWSWDFGDGSGASTRSASHTYTSAGNYLVRLTAMNAGGATTATTTVSVLAPLGPTVFDRVNAGGSALTGGWAADTSTRPSSWVNDSVARTATGSTGSTIAMTDPSIPAGTPSSMFRTSRYDTSAGSDMIWTLPVPNAGTYTVRLYFAETYWTSTGRRTFNVSINGSRVLTSFDILAAAGGAKKGIVRTFTVTTSGSITVAFGRTTHDNPMISGIDVVAS